MTYYKACSFTKRKVSTTLESLKTKTFSCKLDAPPPQKKQRERKYKIVFNLNSFTFSLTKIFFSLTKIYFRNSKEKLG